MHLVAKTGEVLLASSETLPKILQHTGQPSVPGKDLAPNVNRASVEKPLDKGFSHLIVYQNKQKGFLKYRFLVPIPRFPDSIGRSRAGLKTSVASKVIGTLPAANS